MLLRILQRERLRLKPGTKLTEAESSRLDEVTGYARYGESVGATFGPAGAGNRVRAYDLLPLYADPPLLPEGASALGRGTSGSPVPRHIKVNRFAHWPNWEPGPWAGDSAPVPPVRSVPKPLNPEAFHLASPRRASDP